MHYTVEQASLTSHLCLTYASVFDFWFNYFDLIINITSKRLVHLTVGGLFLLQNALLYATEKHTPGDGNSCQLARPKLITLTEMASKGTPHNTSTRRNVPFNITKNQETMHSWFQRYRYVDLIWKHPCGILAVQGVQISVSVAVTAGRRSPSRSLTDHFCVVVGEETDATVLASLAPALLILVLELHKHVACNTHSGC